MKQFLFSLIAVALVFSVTSCKESEDDNGGQNNPEVTNQYTLVGTLTVDQLNGSNYVMDSVRIAITPNDTLGTMTMVMYQVRFSSRMPVKLDMTVRNINYVSNQDGFVLSGDSIVPYAMGGPFAAYTITDLIGTLTDDSLRLSMNCGIYPMTFKGIR